MKRAISVLLILTLLFSLGGSLTTDVFAAGELYGISQLPEDLHEYPSQGQKYWVLFNEGLRNDRFELSTFDVTDAAGDVYIVWSSNLVAKSDGGTVSRSNQFHYTDTQWIYDRNYGVLSDKASTVFASNVNVYDASGNLLIEKTEWEGTVEQFSADYDFNRDRYHFRNFEGTISEDIYKDIYGKEKGQILFDKYETEPHGLCYGMAVTTGSLLSDIPHVNSFIRLLGPCDAIRDINKGTLCYDLNGISAKQFIRYGHATQFSVEAETSFGNCQEIYDKVAEYVSQNGAPVTISLKEYQYNREESIWEQSFGHRVLAVGLSGDNGIIVDDSNFDTKQTIFFERDDSGKFTNEWHYSAYSQTNGDNVFDPTVGRCGRIGYSTDVILPYLVLSANATLNYPDTSEENEDSTATFSIDPIDTEYNLIAVTSDHYAITDSNHTLREIQTPELEEDRNPDNTTVYWADNAENVTVSDVLGAGNKVAVAGNAITISAAVEEGSDVFLTANEKANDKSVGINTPQNEPFTMMFGAENDAGERVSIVIAGTPEEANTIAVKTESGIAVSGISKGVVTLDKDGETLASEQIDGAKGRVEIVYDPSGENQEIAINYAPADACSNGHTWGAWTQRKAAACAKEGWETRTCLICGEAESRETSALGHTWDTGIVTTKPTATKPGVRTYTCTRCGETRTETIPATGKSCDGGANCPGRKFTDMPAANNWAHAGIDFVLENGLFAGLTDTTFGPGDTMTRAMLVTVLWRLEGKPEASGYAPFTDVPDGKYYTAAVRWANANGIVAGTDSTHFNPNSKVTREQIAAILFRYAAKKGYDTSARANLNGFPDARSVSSYAKNAVAWANAEGIVSGSKNASTGIVYLDPKGNATRAQVASIIQRFAEHDWAIKEDIQIATDYYTLTLPGTWDGHYIVDRYTDTWDSSLYTIRVSCKESFETGFGGHLFSLGLYSSADDYRYYPNYRELGTLAIPDLGTYYVAALFPTDAEFNNAGADASIYLQMSAETDKALETLEGRNGAVYSKK